MFEMIYTYNKLLRTLAFYSETYMTQLDRQVEFHLDQMLYRELARISLIRVDVMDGAIKEVVWGAPESE